MIHNRIAVQRTIEHQGISVLVFALNIDEGNTKLLRFDAGMENPEMVEVAPGALAAGASLIMSDSDAQRLMDELHAAGIRRTHEFSTDGERSALQAHLSDMRTLVSKTLEVALDNPGQRF